MANEITAQAKLSISKNGVTVTGDNSKLITLTGNGKYSNVQNIGNGADEAITFAQDLVNEGVGFIFFKNLDSANYVELSMGTGGGFAAGRFAKLKAGESALIRSPIAAPGAPGTNPGIYAQANTAAINLEVVATGT